MPNYDKIHYDLLVRSIGRLNNILSAKLSKYIYFTGGTSLMLKYSKFYRFSVDLDFSVDIEAKQYEDEFYELFANLKRDIEKHLRTNNNMVFESENSREIYFLGENWTRWIKIDWMYDQTTVWENIKINNNIIQKASDLDIIANKLMRLNKTDIEDIKFLLSKNNIWPSHILDCLSHKSAKLHWDKSYLTNKAKHLRRQNVKNLSFLENLIWK